MITCSDIKPKEKGISDFYSWQLYKWVKKFPNRLTVWSATWNSATGVDEEKRSLYIGDQRDGNFIHARQLRNLCTYGHRIEAYAYGRCHDTKNWEDITGWFWSEYMRIGICAIHGDYAHSWDIDTDVRICERCGKKEIRKFINVPTELWEAV